MGKYDDFNLDINKIKTNGNIEATSWEWITPSLATIATECHTVNGGNTCNCPSTNCSPSDMTACGNAKADAVINC